MVLNPVGMFKEQISIPEKLDVVYLYSVNQVGLLTFPIPTDSLKFSKVWRNVFKISSSFFKSKTITSEDVTWTTLQTHVNHVPRDQCCWIIRTLTSRFRVSSIRVLQVSNHCVHVHCLCALYLCGIAMILYFLKKKSVMNLFSNTCPGWKR